MFQAYNAYVVRVLEVMVSQSIPLDQATHLCRQHIQEIEHSYVRLLDVKVVAASLLA